KDLVSMTRPQPGLNIIYTADSNWFLYHDQDANGREGLYRISTGGGQPQRLGDMPSNAPGVWIGISPDGRSVLTWGRSNNEVHPEFWMLQNFLPKSTTPTTKTAAKPASK